MVDREQVRRLMGIEVHDRDGSRIGRVSEVYLDDETGQPSLVTVDLGMLSTREAFVPLGTAHEEAKGLVVPWTSAQVKASPQILAHGGSITPDEKYALLQHYGISHAAGRRGAKLLHHKGGA